MTEQQTPDREKKIAEIREALKWVEWGKYPITAYASLEHWLRFLLSELERKDEVIEEQKRELFYKSKEITELREKSWQDQQWFKQASANITEMQKELDREREENRKLRERLKEELVWQDECLKLEEQLQSAQQEIERLREELNAYKPSAEVFYERLQRLVEERDKLIKLLDMIKDDADRFGELVGIDVSETSLEEKGKVFNRKIETLQEERDKLIEGLRVYLADLAERHHEAMQKWDREADMYEQGAACAYDIAESMLRDILKEIGVTLND